MKDTDLSVKRFPVEDQTCIRIGFLWTKNRSEGLTSIRKTP